MAPADIPSFRPLGPKSARASTSSPGAFMGLSAIIDCWTGWRESCQQRGCILHKCQGCRLSEHVADPAA
eukprot:10194506-Alexandrium_andersonii.AAC.1